MPKVSEEFGDLQFTGRTSIGCFSNVGNSVPVLGCWWIHLQYISINKKSLVAGDKSYRPGQVLHTWATYMSGLLCNVK